MDRIADVTTMVLSQERLQKAGVIEELFETFEPYRPQILHARGGPLPPALTNLIQHTELS